MFDLLSCDSVREAFEEEDSRSGFLGEVIDCLLWTGGGDLRRGETGQRGVSLISCPGKGFTGVGALIVESDRVGCSKGVEVADNALCVAAADGGLVLMLVGARDGLSSCTLFFLDLLGPVVRTEEALGFSGARTGEDSREAWAELVADEETRAVAVFLVGGFKAGVESRGFGVVELVLDDCRTDSGDSALADAVFVHDGLSSIVPVRSSLSKRMVGAMLRLCRCSQATANDDIPGVHQFSGRCSISMWWDLEQKSCAIG